MLKLPTHLQDLMLRGFSYQDLIDTVVCNEPVRDEKAFKKVFNELLDSLVEEAKFNLKDNMKLLLKGVPKED